MAEDLDLELKVLTLTGEVNALKRSVETLEEKIRIDDQDRKRKDREENEYIIPRILMGALWDQVVVLGVIFQLLMPPINVIKLIGVIAIVKVFLRIINTVPALKKSSKELFFPPIRSRNKLPK